MSQVLRTTAIALFSALAVPAGAATIETAFDPAFLIDVPLELVPTEAPALEPFVDIEAPPEPQVDDADAMATLCTELHKKLTSVSFEECMGRGLFPSGAVSTRGTTIAMRDYAPANGEPSGRVLLVGGIHGDEYSSVTAVFKWIKHLEKGDGGQFYWRVVPLLNPDGLLMPPDMSQRMNANGVDLNRNFPTPNWKTEAMDYWVNRTRRSKRRYPGPSPLSEPESKWLASQIDEFEPDAVISVHAPHGIVDFDGPRTPPDNLGPLELRLLGTYPGSMGRYIGVYRGIPLLTVELESALRLPEPADMDGIWFDTIDWLSARVGRDAERDNGIVAAPDGPALPVTSRDSGAPFSDRD